jgi:hypothetical protein
MAASCSPSFIIWWLFTMGRVPLSTSWSLTHGEYDAINLSSARTSEIPSPNLVCDGDPPLEDGGRHEEGPEMLRPGPMCNCKHPSGLEFRALISRGA